MQITVPHNTIQQVLNEEIFPFRLLLFVAIVAVLILLIGLFLQFETLSTRIDELTARVQRLDEANAAPARARRAGAATDPNAHSRADRNAHAPTRAAERAATTLTLCAWLPSAAQGDRYELQGIQRYA